MTDREKWIEILVKIASPVLKSAAEEKLKINMPVEAENPDERRKYTGLEALGRTICGLSAWISNPDDELSEEYARLSRDAIKSIVTPGSKDYVKLENTQKNSQFLVDSAFLAQGVIRARHQLFDLLDDKTKEYLIAFLKNNRQFRPGRSNWLLFSGEIEAALMLLGEEPDFMRIDYCIYQFEQWYKGDGVYGDGSSFKWDYYNSYVIIPMLIDIISIFKDYFNVEMYNTIIKNGIRYAQVLESLIGPDGTYPILGRSIAYRCGAFQLLGQIALMEKLPQKLSYESVRCAMTALIEKSFSKADTFDDNGWLTIGVNGHQPYLGEDYISTGSLYLCTGAFLPLGLDKNHKFWSGEKQPWTSKKIWG